MSRDYAKRRKTKGGYSPSKKSTIPWWFVTITLVFLAAFIGGLFYITSVKQPKTTAVKPTSTQATAEPVKPAKPRFEFYTLLPTMEVAVPAEKPADKPPNAQQQRPAALPVPAPAAKLPATTPIGATTQPTAKPTEQPVKSEPSPKIGEELEKPSVLVEKPKSNAATDTHYMLQVASFQKYTEADNAKADLAMRGFNVSIKTVHLARGPVNRVFVGPYKSLSAAQDAQKQLAQHRYKSFITKG